MNMNDITDSIKNRYGNRKEYKLTSDFDGSIINFIETCLTKKEKMSNKLANTDINKSNIFCRVFIFMENTLEEYTNINFSIELALDGYSDNDTIYHFDFDINIDENDNISKINEIFNKIDFVTDLVLNIKIDISEIKKIFIKAFGNRLDKEKIKNFSTSFKKYKYLDKNNILDILNIVDKFTAYKNYIEYRNAIFKLIIKDFKKCLIDMTGS